MQDQERRELGAEIRRRRKGRKLTQRQLADEAGISLRTMVSIEKGEHSTQPGNAEAVMRVLGIDVDATMARASWPPDVQVFLDMMGAFLSTLPEQARLEVIGEITRSIYRRSPST